MARMKINEERGERVSLSLFRGYGAINGGMFTVMNRCFRNLCSYISSVYTNYKEAKSHSRLDWR